MKAITVVAATAAVVLAATLIAAEAPAPAPSAKAAPAAGEKRLVTAEEVANSINKAVAFLKSRQNADGSWPYPGDHMQGMAALSVLTLSEAGVSPKDPAIVKGMDYVFSKPLTGTYDAACAALAIASVDPSKYLRYLAETRDYLQANQDRNGMWVYAFSQADRGGGDNSNTQFAMLGLYASMSVGLPISVDTLRRAYGHYVNSQNADGGWGYKPGDSSYGSMTAAGVGALAILGASLYSEGETCGQYKQDPKLAAGVSWLARNYSIRENPGREQIWIYYYLYALERVGVLTGEKYIAGHDWYLEGCRFVVDTQATGGNWTTGPEMLPNTCFCTLFLAKGNVPVLINKLSFGEAAPDIHDTQNVTRFISSNFGQQVGWQTVTMDDSLETLLSAPILYVTGHSFPEFSDAAMAKLSAYFENGGFMLADSCCGSAVFEQGFKRWVAKMFPELPVAKLDISHPVWRLLFNIHAPKHPLFGIDAGCRTMLMFSPVDLSCAWERNDLANQIEAFQIGANVAAYVTGKERLQPKLQQYKSIQPQPQVVTSAPTAFTFAQVMYAGPWNPHPLSGVKLLAFLNAKAGLYTSSKVVTLPLTDPNLANYPFIYMTGRSRFTLSAEEKKALADYLKRGGFLFADATGGRAEFDESFRPLMQEVLPGSPLEPIPADSPIYKIAFDTTHVKYTALVRESSPNLDTLTLYGAKVGDRIAVVYSPYDIGCALEQFPSYGSKGLVSEDAFKAAANIVLYALSY